MRVLITGLTGMVGSHLADYIHEEHPDVKIHGLTRWRSPLDNIQHLRDQVTLHHGDLKDLSSLCECLEGTHPDWIFHLAAQSYVDFSFVAPAATMQTNAIGTLNLLEAVRLQRDIGWNAWSPLIHICSSSEVYGQVEEHETPILETQPFRPASPYAVSKVAADTLAEQYWRSYGLDIVRTRMFTHTGPRRGDVFAESSFAKQIAEIEAGCREGPVKVGNLDSLRTLCDVRDAVRAYWLLMEKCPAGEVYNIGGHTTMTIGEVLDQLLALSPRAIDVEVDPARLRPSDVTRQIPDTRKFCKATGWAPRIPVEVTLEDLLDWHRDRLRRCS